MKNILFRYHIPLLISCICLILALLNDPVSDFLRFDRSAIANGQLWRLITANLLHTNFNHMLINSAGLWLIWGIFWDIGNKKTQWSFLLFPILLNTSILYFLVPEVNYYVGLSGALHGTIIAFGIADFNSNKLTSIGLIIGVSIKIAYELIMGSSEWTTSFIEADVVEEAHLWGAVSGLITGLIYLKFFSPAPNSQQAE